MLNIFTINVTNRKIIKNKKNKIQNEKKNYIIQKNFKYNFYK